MDTGKAKVVYRHMAFIGQESQWAAEASECANEQSKFWDFANYVFDQQAGENQGAFSRDNLKGFAKQAGLDAAKFSACFDEGRYSRVVQQDTAEGERRGVVGTPTLFINGQRYEINWANPNKSAIVKQLGAIIDSLQH